MKNPLPWWIALAAWLAGAVYVHMCFIKQVCCQKQQRIPAIEIKDSTLLDLHLDGLLFARTRADLYSDPTAKFILDSLAVYLKSRPNRRLTITGYHTATEAGQSVMPDLGVARALSVQHYLLSAGIPPNNIETKGLLTASLAFLRDSTNGLAFAFDQVPATENDLAYAQRFVDIFHTLDLYFPTGQAQYIKTPDTERFVAEAITYLRANPRARFMLTGHTDNVGSDASNIRLSRKRAETVRKRMSSQGIRFGQIETFAKGESQPKASNETPEGRRANRRVSIVVVR